MISEAFRELAWMHAASGRQNVTLDDRHMTAPRRQFYQAVMRARGLGDVLAGRRPLRAPMAFADYATHFGRVMERMAEALGRDIVAMLEGADNPLSGLLGADFASVEMRTLAAMHANAEAETAGAMERYGRSIGIDRGGFDFAGVVTGRMSASRPNPSARPGVQVIDSLPDMVPPEVQAREYMRRHGPAFGERAESMSVDGVPLEVGDAVLFRRQANPVQYVNVDELDYDYMSTRLRSRPTRFKRYGHGCGGCPDPEQRPIYADDNAARSRMRGTPNNRVWKPRGKGKHR